MVCPAVAHRLPEVFANPDMYDPDRFAPDRAEDQKQPYGLIGFGGGRYRCPGANFGTHEMKCILSLLLRRYSLELMDPNAGPDFQMGVVRPQPPCRVRYRQRLAHQPVAEDGLLAGGPIPSVTPSFSGAGPNGRGTADVRSLSRSFTATDHPDPSNMRCDHAR